MSRRNRSPTDSTELLLDTICNTFGGVLFIAILVVILLQTSFEQPQDEDRGPSASPEDITLLNESLRTAQAELDRLRALKAGQDATLMVHAPEVTRALLEERDASAEQRQSMQSERVELLTTIGESTARIEQVDRDLHQMSQDLESARQLEEEISAQIGEGRERRTEEIHMPVVRPADHRTQVQCVLHYGRFYVWHNYDQFGRRLGLNTTDFVILGETAGGVRTTPKPTAGIAVEDTPESRSAIVHRLRQFSTESCYVCVVVRPDSYAEFRYLRDAMLEGGFDYEIFPAADELVVDRGGQSRGVQ